MSRGIDYSGIVGTCNRNPKTGIRYGIIPTNLLTQWVWESFEPDYGDPHCPECGGEAIEGESKSKVSDPPGEWVTVWSEHPESTEDYEEYDRGCNDYRCDNCRILFGSESAFPDEVCGNILDDGEYKANIDDSNDCWVFESPYYTHAAFCSPCAPGACYLSSPCPEGAKAYCMGVEWFDASDSGKADDCPCPYPIYRVDTGECIYVPLGKTFKRYPNVKGGE